MICLFSKIPFGLQTGQGLLTGIFPLLQWGHFFHPINADPKQ